MSLHRKLKKNINKKPTDLFIVNKRTPLWKALLLASPALAILIVFTIVPFIYAIRDGFTIDDKNPLTPHSANLDNFSFVIKDEYFHQAVTNSVIYAFVLVPITMIVALLISSAIASVIRKRLRGVLQTIFFLPYVTSAISISLAFAFIFDYDSGLINMILTKLGMKKFAFLTDTEGKRHALIVFWTLGVWRSIAFNVLIFTTAMLGVDKTKYKAASIDGASKPKQFFSITLPSINRTTNFLLIMGIIGSIKVFPLALFNNDPGIAKINGGYTLMLYVYGQIDAANYGRAGVASLYLLVISISFSVVLKGGFNQVLKLGNYIGERNVENKIKNFKIRK